MFICLFGVGQAKVQQVAIHRIEPLACFDQRFVGDGQFVFGCRCVAFDDGGGSGDGLLAEDFDVDVGEVVHLLSQDFHQHMRDADGHAVGGEFRVEFLGTSLDASQHGVDQFVAIRDASDDSGGGIGFFLHPDAVDVVFANWWNYEQRSGVAIGMLVAACPCWEFANGGENPWMAGCSEGIQ